MASYPSGLVCVNCMEPCETLYKKYSEEVIRLTECKKCKKVVDKYIEVDMMLIVIDLILHYSEAYRHVLYNMQISNYIRISVIFLFCDAYHSWIDERSLVMNVNIYDLEWIFYRSLLKSVVSLGVYILTILLFESIVNKGSSRVEFITKSCVIGYFGNIAVVLTIIFRLSSELSYRVATHIFIFISHVQVQRALYPSWNLFLNTVIVVFASLASFASSNLFEQYVF